MESVDNVRQTAFLAEIKRRKKSTVSTFLEHLASSVRVHFKLRWAALSARFTVSVNLEDSYWTASTTHSCGVGDLSPVCLPVELNYPCVARDPVQCRDNGKLSVCSLSKDILLRDGKPFRDIRELSVYSLSKDNPFRHGKHFRYKGESSPLRDKEENHFSNKGESSSL